MPAFNFKFAFSSFIQLLVLLCTVTFISLKLPAQQKLKIAGDNKSAYVIILSSNAGVSEKRAAGLLKENLLKITGVELPVFTDNKKKVSATEIVIGKTNRSFPAQAKELNTLDEDGYWIKTAGKKIFIAGGNGKGVVYGVVSFLEDYLGCRKFSPEVEYIPEKKELIITAIDDRQVPPSKIRVVNGAFAGDDNYKDWRKLNTIADYWNDGEWRGYYVHTFNRLVPSEKYFETHPEYFALVNGKRIPYGQLCLSNPDVLKITMEQLKKDMAEHPAVKYWSVSQNDNYYYCQCDACKKMDDEDGSAIGSMLKFVNKVAAAFPAKTITTLAYQYTRKPPLKTKPLPNVMITLCSIELNRSLPIETDPGSKSFVEDMVGWSKICKNIMLWDYEVQFTNYLCPFPLFHTLKPNLQFFTKYGVVANFQQCNAVHGVEFAELKTYLLSKLLWNPDADDQAIINDFMKGYYKEAAPFIRKYFDLLHKNAAASKQGLDIYGTPVWSANTFLSAAKIKEYYNLFDEAEAAVKDQPEIVERVKIDRLCVQYADMEIAKTDMFGERGWYKIENGKYILKPERKQLIEDFYSTCKKNNVVQLNETGLTAETYYNNTLRFIDVQVEGNLAFQKKVTCTPAPHPNYTGSGAQMLTNGVKGTDDYKINWLGWEGTDAEIVIDLAAVTEINEVTISSLSFPKSWILHPSSVKCLISNDGSNYTDAGFIESDKDSRHEPQMKNFSFNLNHHKTRFVKFVVTGTKILPAWHAYTGNKSWMFIDEVVIR